MLTQMFAPFLIEGRGSDINWRESIPKAESIMRALITCVYQIFPIDVRLLPPPAIPYLPYLRAW